MKKKRTTSPGQLSLSVDGLIQQERNEGIRQRLKNLPPTYYIPTVSAAAELRAWPTEYKGINHRSRAEARWAVLFDLLGIHYVYEMEKINMKAGASIPDFFLPHYDTWVEVGPDMLEIHELKQEKAQRLSDATGRAVLVTKGFPRVSASHLIAGCSLTLPSPHEINPVTVAKHYPGLCRLKEWTGPDVSDAIGVAQNFQFEAIRDFSKAPALKEELIEW